MNWAAIVWFVLLILFLFMESTTVAIVSMWFAAGALTAMVTSLLGGPVWLQVVLFFVVSIGLLLAFRPIVKKHFIPRLTKTNLDSVIGSVGIVTADIDNIAATGQIKLGAMEWTARSTSGQVIPSGTQVKVDRIEGVKVYVSPAEVTVQ